MNAESQNRADDNQAVVILSQPPEEIQMDTNGDGVVDEFESQNQSVHLTQPTQAVHHLQKKSRWIQTVMVL